jgi:hypothetical protein
MSVYNAPILHNGTLNAVVNSTDFTSNNSTSSLNVATADSRYLKLTGGTLTGDLTLPSEYNTGTINTPTITFNSNSTAQTAGMLGYVYSSSGSTSNFSSGTLISLASISSLPIGVYILTSQISITNTDISNNLVFSQLSHGFSNIGSTTTPNTSIYEITNATYILTPALTSYLNNSYIFKNTTQGNLNLLFNPVFTGTTSTGLTYYISAMRIA